MSLLVLGSLVIGVLCGVFWDGTTFNFTGEVSTFLLWLMIFSVGIDIGLNKEVFRQIKEMGIRTLLIPLGIAAGSLLGGVVASFFVQETVTQCLAIVSGMGWYSLSGILLTEAGYPALGTISFLSNVFREVSAFLIIPILAKKLGPYCAIAPGGATTMDTTLPVIARNTNGKIAIIAFVSGVILTSTVPLLIPLFI